MSVWGAITLTLLASACMNLGLVLQKKGVSGPSLVPSGHPGKFRPAPTWYLGMALLLGGYAVYGYALSARAAPISLLQPLSASGLLVVGILAGVYLKERFAAWEWFGVALLLGGVILLGFSAENSPHWTVGVRDPWLFGFLIVTVISAAFVIVTIRRTANPARAEFLYGLLAGLLLGNGYLHTKILSLAYQEQRLGLDLLAVACMIVGLGGGLAVLQMGFRRGRALIVTAVNLVTNQVLVVTGGVICLGERFPTQPLPLTARVAGLAGILAGIALLARLTASANSRATAAEVDPADSL